MLVRIISGIVLVLITASSLIFGGCYLFCVCLFISLAGMYEYYKAVGLQRDVLGIIGYVGAAACYAYLFAGHTEMLLFALTIIAMAMLVAYVLAFPKYNISEIAKAYLGVIYVAIMISYIYQTRMMNNGEYTSWLIFICSWGSDTFAYLIGSVLGKHKMAPHLSPNKSVEGAAGGIAGAALLGALFGWAVQSVTGMGVIPAFTIASAIGAVVSIFGDLAASAIKRNYDIKDYGKIIPGHGGILDRYDSVIFTAPVVYWVLYFIS